MLRMLLRFPKGIFDGAHHLRLADVLKLVPVCKTAWYNGVRSGEFPQPVALGKRARGYRVEDVRALIDRLNAGEGAANA